MVLPFLSCILFCSVLLFLTWGICWIYPTGYFPSLNWINLVAAPMEDLSRSCRCKLYGETCMVSQNNTFPYFQKVKAQFGLMSYRRYLNNYCRGWENKNWRSEVREGRKEGRKSQFVLLVQANSIEPLSKLCFISKNWCWPYKSITLIEFSKPFFITEIRYF